jgi:hypothetical protein
MLATFRKCTLSLLGMAAAGSILGAKGSYARTWYGPFVDKPRYIIAGAALGLLLGLVFSVPWRGVGKDQK